MATTEVNEKHDPQRLAFLQAFPAFNGDLSAEDLATFETWFKVWKIAIASSSKGAPLERRDAPAFKHTVMEQLGATPREVFGNIGAYRGCPEQDRVFPLGPGVLRSLMLPYGELTQPLRKRQLERYQDRLAARSDVAADTSTSEGDDGAGRPWVG
jgi:hypothetical protein